MKNQLLALVVISVMVFITACGDSGEENTYNSDWQGAMTQSQGIQIEQTGGTVVADYSEQTRIDDFLNKLDIQNWSESESSENAEMEYSVKFFKEGSLGDDGDDSSRTVSARIITYKGSSIITLESLGLSLDFEVPQSALDAVRNP